MNSKNIAILVGIVMMCFFSGCAGFRAGHLQPITQWPPEPAANKKSISIIVSGEATYNSTQLKVNSKFSEIWREQTIKAYNDSGLFSEVKTILADTDLRAEIKIMDRAEVNLGLATLTGLTLCIIPSSSSDEVIIKTIMKDKAGNILGNYEKSETITVWYQLFMILAMPSNFPNSVAKETLYDINRSTIKEARSQGVL